MIGEAIMRVREQRGMTRRGLAKATGKSASLISLIERGMRNPSMTTIMEFAKALSVPLPVLIHAAYPECSSGCETEMNELALDILGFVLHND